MRRSMRLFAVLPAVAAVILPPLPVNDNNVEPHVSTPEIYELADSRDAAIFDISCPGCLNGDSSEGVDDRIEFAFHASGADTPCDVSDATLNGRSLKLSMQQAGDEFASGLGRFPIRSNRHDPEPRSEVLALWSLTCVWGSDLVAGTDAGAEPIPVFSVSIKEANEHVIKENVGFSIFYRQSSTPELLRISPLSAPVTDDGQETWKHPSALDISALCVSDESETTSIDADVAQLEALELHVAELELLIEKKKKALKSRLVGSSLSFKQEMRQCSDVNCMTKTLLRGAHNAAQVAYNKLHRRFRRHDQGVGRLARQNVEELWTGNVNRQSFVSISPPPSAQPKNGCKAIHSRPSSMQTAAGSELTRQYLLALDGPTINPFILSIQIVSFVALAVSLFIFLRRSCNIRRRTERRARREERRAATLYRRAARRQAWQNWWSGLGRRSRRRPQPPTDYETKRAMVVDQEAALERAMQDEIRQLRDAHRTVDSIVNTGSISSPSYGYGIRPVARTDSLPDYRSDSGGSEPPAYESDDDTSAVVTDGFSRYTPSSTISILGASAPSSVVEVSPRPSAETTRTSSTFYDRM